MEYYGQKEVKNGGKITKEEIDNFHDWICNHTQVLNSPLRKDHVNFKDNTTG